MKINQIKQIAILTLLVCSLPVLGSQVKGQTGNAAQRQGQVQNQHQGTGAARRFVPVVQPSPKVFRPITQNAPGREALVRGQDIYGAPLAATQAAPAPAVYNPNSQPIQQPGGYFPQERQPATGARLPGGDITYFDNSAGTLGPYGDSADIDIRVPEGSTGRFLFGGAYNSDAGITGKITIDERNFDIRRFPRNFGELVDGRAFRGRGQHFRMELIPGSQLQRYLVSLSDPYLWDTNINFSVSGYYFKRRYFDWDEERLGGRVSLGYRLTPDLSVSVALKAENVGIDNPRLGTSPTLNSALGDTDLFVGSVTMTHDTRDHPFLPTEGRFLEMSFSQGFGEFDYSRGEVDWRRYFLLYERPDRTGRHTISVGSKLGISGSQTPIFENYFAGGFSTLRGFDFRGASPVEGGVTTGGRFQWLNTVEYTFPLSGDDMIKGVAFVDFGTVENDIKLSGDSFRVSPGLGLRIHMPALGGGGAPLAFDFSVPVSRADTDDTKLFSFYLGFNR